MRHDVRITKLTKKIEFLNPANGKTEIKDDVKFAFDKDVERYLDAGYKDVEIIREQKDFTPPQKAYYLDGDESQKRKTVKISPEDKAKKSFENEITNMTVDELQELADRYQLNLLLGTYETVALKRKAVLEAVVKQEQDYKADQAKKEEPVEDEESDDLEAELKAMTVKKLEAYVEDNELDIDLGDYSKKAEKVSAILDVIENKG